MSVSSVGSYHKYGFIDNQGKQYDVRDVHEVALGHPDYTHQHNDSIDLVAPGYSVARLVGFSGYKLGWGTSYASPMVAGTVALMYDVYPTIHPDDVLRILQETADDKIYDIPENFPYDGLLGAGRLNAYGAVLKAQCEYNGNPIGLDLNMQDTKEDYGVEPYPENDPIWNSPDIWVRNTNDGFLYKESEDLHFVDSNTPVYVYVRVTNDSCHPSSGTEQLELYWAKGGLNQTWSIVWDGSSNPMDAPNGSGQQFDIGNQVGVQSIPEIETGKYEILEFEWYPQNPEAYENAGFEKPWMFCFLSRIVTPDDPMTFPEGPNAATNTRNNNNIAYHNATVINVNQPNNQGSIVAGNIGNNSTIISDIEFFTNTPNDDNLWQDAEVRVELNEDLWTLWQDSGAQSDFIRVLDPSRRQIMVMSNHASLNDIEMGDDEWGIATVGVNFLIHQVDAQEEYNLHVQQLYTDTQESLGGFSFTFNRDNQRQEFDAETRALKIMMVLKPFMHKTLMKVQSIIGMTKMGF
ncbi:S8 family serine peptidase [Flavobacterium sp. CS20]|nr:S8 family serine peptidase [Flavobacterium sp. CS20]